MLYIGFPVSVVEALRLLKLNESLVNSYYDTDPIQLYLKQEGTHLVFRYIDKGSCLFGLPVSTFSSMDDAYSSVEDTIFNILGAKRMFLDECKNLNIDWNHVEVTWIEEEGKILENPQPFVISL